LVRLKLYSLWAWLIITAFTDTTHVTATVQLGTEFGGPMRSTVQPGRRTPTIPPARW
jgi:hypothetical protein